MSKKRSRRPRVKTYTLVGRNSNKDFEAQKNALFQMYDDILKDKKK